MVKDIKKNLTNIVIIIGLVSSIGVGFSKFGKLELTIEQLSNQTTVDYSSQIAVLEEKVTALENRKSVDISGVNTRSKINEKEIKLLQLQINEIKVLNSNPLQ